MIKKCKIHGVTKHNKRVQLNSYRCSKCANEAVSRRRRLIKKMAVEYKGGKCSICGYDKCINALIFHHKNPSEKDFIISHSGTKSWQRVKNELEKCILVCNNCHAEIHEKIFKTHNPELDLRLNKSMRSRGSKLLRLCVDCNKKIQGKNRCKECYLKNKPTKIQWPTPNEVLEMVKQSSFLSIGKKLGVSDTAIRKFLRKHSLI